MSSVDSGYLLRFYAVHISGYVVYLHLSSADSDQTSALGCISYWDIYIVMFIYLLKSWGDGRVVRWSWVNFHCRGVLLLWIRVGQGPSALAVGAGGGCLDIFTLVYPFSFLSPSLWETTRYRLKYCLKGSLSPKTTNQQLKSWAA